MRGCELELVVEQCGRKRPECEGQVSECVFLGPGSRSRAGGGVIHGRGELFQAMGLDSEAVLADVAVG